MKMKKINKRTWKVGSRKVWLNYNSQNKVVWGVLSNSNVILTNGFKHFYQAIEFINQSQSENLPTNNAAC
ncbi:hypothetical protein ACNO5E_14120 [Vibrio parahaemolyticus]